MILSIVLAGLLQAQEPTIDGRIAAFLKGDAAARAELVKLGGYAIRPLQRTQTKDQRVLDDLVFELKKAAAFPSWPEISERLEWPGGYVGSDLAVESLAVHVNNMGIPGFVDEIDPARLKSKTFSVHGLPLRATFDDIARQTGLDWGLFHHHVVFGHPDRLWPSGPPVKVTELTEEAVARAKRLIEQLGDEESLQSRESARKQLKAMGPAILKLLEANAARTETEIANRCKSLIEELRVTPAGRFGKAGADRQLLTGEDEKLHDRLRAFKATVSFNRLTIRDIAAHFEKIDKLPIDVDASVPDKPLTAFMKAQHVHDILALITQSQGLDFEIKNGRIVIGVAK